MDYQSQLTWQNDASTTRGYRFSYDGLSRLKDAIYGEGEGLTRNTHTISIVQFLPKKWTINLS